MPSQDSIRISAHGWEKIKEPHIVYAIIIGIGLSAVQQFTGVVRSTLDPVFRGHMSATSFCCFEIMMTRWIY